MLKLKNKKNIRLNTLNGATVIFLFFILLAFLIISLTSCSLLMSEVVTSKTDISVNQEGSGSNEESTEADNIEQEASQVEEVDFTKAIIGAEIKGYIPSYLLTDKDNFIKIEIKNTSDFTWRTDVPNMVRIGYHYYGQDVDFVSYDKTSRTVIPHEVSPGETVSIDVLINDIKNEGTYTLQIEPLTEGSDIVDNNFWFSSKGVRMIEGTVYFGPSGN